MLFREKRYVYAYRNFALTPSAPLPEVLELDMYISANTDPGRQSSMSYSVN